VIPEPLIEKLQDTQHLAILTDAGVLAEYGIATFRDALTGLWENYDAESLACESRAFCLITNWHGRSSGICQCLWDIHLPNWGHTTQSGL
jgi:hypothetical protein